MSNCVSKEMNSKINAKGRDGLRIFLQTMFRESILEDFDTPDAEIGAATSGIISLQT